MRDASRRRRLRNRTDAGRRVMEAWARRAEWHCMFTATGFMVMWVAAISTWTANDVESPPSPWGPTPSVFTAAERLFSRAAPSGSSQALPSGRVAARLARATQRSDVPPMPTPMMVGGHVLPPASSTQSMTNVLMALTPSAGIAILSHELFSLPLPLGTISISRRSSSQKSMWIGGTPGPHEVCWFLRVMGCTTEERSGCSRVARSQPRRIAASSSTPSISTPRPIVTL